MNYAACRRWRWFWLLPICSLLLGCDRQGALGPDDSPIRFAVVPDESPQTLIDKYSPLMTLLSENTGRECELVIPADYAELLSLFRAAKVDVAHFGGYGFHQARISSDARPLVMRNIDSKFTSYVISLKSKGFDSLQTIAGSRFAFGPRLSTSGHIMPRFFFDRLGLDIGDKFAELEHSRAHDQTLEWVLSGRGDAGVANSQIINNLMAKDPQVARQIAIVWESPPYADYVWAAQPGLGKELTVKIRDTFLRLSPASDQALLQNLGASYFLPASEQDFVDLAAAIASVEHRLQEGRLEVPR